MVDFVGEELLKDWYVMVGCNVWWLEEFYYYYGNVMFDDGGMVEVLKFLLWLYVEKCDECYGVVLEWVIGFVLVS